MAMDYYNSGAMIALVVIIWLVSLSWMVVNYILTSLAHYTVAKRRGIKYPGLAWVPLVWVWTQGSICDQYDGTRGIRRKWRVAYLTLMIITYVGLFVAYIIMLVQLTRMTISSVYAHGSYYYLTPEEFFGSFGGIFVLFLAGIIAALGLTACQTVCRYKFFESCRPKEALKYMLLSYMVPFAYPICLMCCRNYDLGMPQPPQQPYYPTYPQQPQQYYAPQQMPKQPQEYYAPQQPSNNDPTPPYNPYQ